MGATFRKLRQSLQIDAKQTAPSSESVPWRIVGIIYAVIMGDALAGEMLSPFVAGTHDPKLPKMRFISCMRHSELPDAFLTKQTYGYIFICDILDMCKTRFGMSEAETGTALGTNYQIWSSGFCF
jgi:hypothetical protein